MSLTDDERDETESEDKEEEVNYTDFTQERCSKQDAAIYLANIPFAHGRSFSNGHQDLGNLVTVLTTEGFKK